MRGLRPLLIGLVLAALGTLATVIWQWFFLRGDASPDEPAAGESEVDQPSTNPLRGPGVWQTPDASPEEVRFAEQRQWMVDRQLAARDIADRNVLAAMRGVPRHEFVPASQRAYAYEDGPLSIGHSQTISQPYIVALMTQLARPTPTSVALDVGTGSGYQAAVLSALCQHVYSIEIVEALADTARQRLDRLGYHNVTVRAGDGYAGWPEHAPFDLIIVAAAPDHVPQPLVAQLKPGGRLVIPVGKYTQNLLVIQRTEDGQVRQQQIVPVVFVPMTGEALRHASAEDR